MPHQPPNSLTPPPVHLGLALPTNPLNTTGACGYILAHVASRRTSGRPTSAGVAARARSGPRHEPLPPGARGVRAFRLARPARPPQGDGLPQSAGGAGQLRPDRAAGRAPAAGVRIGTDRGTVASPHAGPSAGSGPLVGPRCEGARAPSRTHRVQQPLSDPAQRAGAASGLACACPRLSASARGLARWIEIGLT